MHDSKKAIHIYFGWYFIIGLFSLALTTYVSGNYLLGHIYTGLFIISFSIYWFYKQSYIGVDLFREKGKNQNDMLKKSTALKILHIFIIINFLIGPLLVALIFYWVGLVQWGHFSIGLFFLWTVLYWFYGVDYFQVEWLQELKNGKKMQNNSSR